MQTHDDRRKGGVNYITGTFFALVAFVEDLLGQVGEDSLADALEQFPPETEYAGGRAVQNLLIRGPQGDVSLRAHYTKVQRVIEYDLRRLGFPRAPLHATRIWRDYRSEIDLVFAMEPGERLSLADQLWAVLMGLPEQFRRAAVGVTERPFAKLLREFPPSQGQTPREPPGALLQALAFAYYRADAPNVTLETGRVGRGSARLGAVGDVDGWIGRTLVLSIEVKDIDVTKTQVRGFGGFLNNVSEWPDATAIVVARSFTDEAVEALAELGVLVLDRDAMARNVDLWDIRKQQLAVREFEFFVVRIERHPALDERFRTWAEAEDLAMESF